MPEIWYLFYDTTWHLQIGIIYSFIRKTLVSNSCFETKCTRCKTVIRLESNRCSNSRPWPNSYNNIRCQILLIDNRLNIFETMSQVEKRKLAVDLYSKGVQNVKKCDWLNSGKVYETIKRIRNGEKWAMDGFPEDRVRLLETI